MVWDPCPTSTPIIPTELSVTAEFSASDSPTPTPIGSPKTPPSGKILSSTPTPARGRTHSFIGVVPPQPWGRGKIPTGWGVLGAPYLPLCHPEWVWLWGLGGFIALFKGLGRQLFNFRWWWGFLYRPSPAGRSPWVLWRNSTTTAAWARAPASLCAAFSARWGRALASNSAGGLSAGFWPYELWNLLLGGFLLGWRSLYLGCLITAWGPGEWTGPWGG